MFRFFGKFYKREYGKYSILQRLFFPYFATKKNERDILTVNKKYKMALDSSEYIQGHLYVFNCFEPSTISTIEQLTKVDDIVFDIGANIGYLSLVFAESVGEKGMVYAFEPEETNFNTLKLNISLNKYDNIFPLKLAVSNVEAKLKLYKASDNNKGSHSTIYNPENLEETFEEVDTIIFDKFIETKGITKVDIIKIDVEGAEYEVILGMKETIERFHPIIFMEMNDPIQEKRGVSTAKLKEIIINYGYNCFNILESGKIEVSPLDFKHQIDNVVFVHPVKIKLVEQVIEK
jgi:FkbM family methyltransferase